MLAEEIQEWMQQKVKERGAKGAVIGLSGGVDSAVVAGLSKRAFGDNCLGVLLPCSGTVSKDREYAHLTSEAFDMETVTVNLKDVYQAYMEAFSGLEIEGTSRDYWPQTNIPTGDVEDQASHNMKPRLRMVALHYLAEKMNYVVMGTSNKSEIVTGYYTNFGDNATDLRPLGDLQKTQVWELAREIDVPREIIERPPTAGLRGEEGDEDEMGVSYRELDKIYRAWQNGEDLDRFDSSTVEQVKSLVKGAEDKDDIPTFKK